MVNARPAERTMADNLGWLDSELLPVAEKAVDELEPVVFFLYSPPAAYWRASLTIRSTTKAQEAAEPAVFSMK